MTSRVASAHGRLTVDGRIARWLRHGALDGRPLVLLAHGAGAPMSSPFMRAVSAGLVRRGLGVVRFHFPYMQRMLEERRRRPPDPAARLLATWSAMLERAASWPAAGPLVLAGKSMGGRMAAQLLAGGGAPRARGVIYLGFPLHPARRPATERARPLAAVKVPQLFISGDRDVLARWDLLCEVVADLGPGARLRRVRGADHSLARGRSEPLAEADAWLDELRDFVAGLAGS